MDDEPEYRTCWYSCRPGDVPPSLTLQLRMRGRYLTIHVRESAFRNSHERLAEFPWYLDALSPAAADDDAASHHADGASVVSDGASAAPPEQRDTVVKECFAWAAEPVLDAFRALAPAPLAPALRITLAAFFQLGAYECALGSVDNCLRAGPIAAVPDPPDGLLALPSKHGPSRFPAIALSGIEVRADDPRRIYDEPPKTVHVQGAEYVFKCYAEGGVGEDRGRAEIRAYERIADAQFDPPVRIARLFGLAVDAQRRVQGALLHRGKAARPLADAVVPGVPLAVRRRWIRQLQQTLGALHGETIVWGNAAVANVYIDEDENACIFDFVGGGIMGDMQADHTALRNIIHFINTGEELNGCEEPHECVLDDTPYTDAMERIYQER